MDRIATAKSLVQVAKELVSGRNNPDVNDIHNASKRIKEALETLRNAAEQLDEPRVLKDLGVAGRMVELASDSLSIAWHRGN